MPYPFFWNEAIGVRIGTRSAPAYHLASTLEWMVVTLLRKHTTSLIWWVSVRKWVSNVCNYSIEWDKEITCLVGKFVHHILIPILSLKVINLSLLNWLWLQQCSCKYCEQQFKHLNHMGGFTLIVRPKKKFRHNFTKKTNNIKRSYLRCMLAV